MQVESKKTFKHGFILAEAELRRFVDTILEQFGKLPEKPNPSITYTFKFKNGAIADTGSLDDVLTQENIGSSQIIRFGAKYIIGSNSNQTIVSFEFINADADDEPGYTSIRYLVRGNSRDWVFVTSNLIDERITRVKRFAFNQVGEKGIGKLVYRIFLPTIIILIFFSFFLVSLGKTMRSEGTVKVSDQVEKAWKEGKIKDPIEAIIFVEKSREQIQEQFVKNPLPILIFLKPLAFAMTPFILLILITLFLWRYYPVYNFCWGDYTELFKRKESVRKFVLSVIIIGIVVSFIGGILANKW